MLWRTLPSTAIGTAPAVERMFAGAARLQSVGQGEVSFLDNRRYAAAPEQTKAGAVIVRPQMQARVPSSAIAIVTASTDEAWARVIALFHPVPLPRPGIHPSALVDADICASARAARSVRRPELSPTFPLARCCWGALRNRARSSSGRWPR